MFLQLEENEVNDSKLVSFFCHVQEKNNHRRECHYIYSETLFPFKTLSEQRFKAFHGSYKQTYQLQNDTTRAS